MLRQVYFDFSQLFFAFFLFFVLFSVFLYIFFKLHKYTMLDNYTIILITKALSQLYCNRLYELCYSIPSYLESNLQIGLHFFKYIITTVIHILLQSDLHFEIFQLPYKVKSKYSCVVQSPNY